MTAVTSATGAATTLPMHCADASPPPLTDPPPVPSPSAGGAVTGAVNGAQGGAVSSSGGGGQAVAGAAAAVGAEQLAPVLQQLTTVLQQLQQQLAPPAGGPAPASPAPAPAPAPALAPSPTAPSPAAPVAAEPAVSGGGAPAASGGCSCSSGAPSSSKDPTQSPVGAAPARSSSPSAAKASRKAENEKIKKWVAGDKKGLERALLLRLAKVGEAAGEKVTVNSGNRTRQEQEALYAKYLNGTGNLAAKPGSSNHEGGKAADVTIGGVNLNEHPKGKKYAAKFGLHFPVAGEPWHAEVKR